MLLNGPPPSLSPYLTAGDIRCRTISKLLFEGLCRLDRHGHPQLAAAETIQIQNNGTRYVFKLRTSNWSNGAALTAFDFLNGWKKILQKKWTSNSPESLFVLKNAKKVYQGLCSDKDLGVSVPSSKTLQLDLEYADPFFLEKLTQPIFFPTSGNTQEPTCFNGPYLVSRYSQKELELEINPFFWDVKKVFFKRIQMRLDSFCIDQACNAFRRGEIDWLGGPFTALSASAIKQFSKEEIVYKRSIKRPFFLHLNTQYSILRSSFIRKALSLSLDRASICKNIFPHHVPLYSSLPLPENKTCQEDVEYAKQLFAKGIEHLGLSKESLSPLEIFYYQGSDQERFSKYLQHLWQHLFGLSVHLHGYPWNTFRAYLEKKHFHIAGCYESALSNDLFEWVHRFQDRDGMSNFSNWFDEQYQQIFSTLKDSTEKTRTHILSETTALLEAETPYIPVCIGSFAYVKHPKLCAEVFDPAGCVDFRFAFLKD